MRGMNGLKLTFRHTAVSCCIGAFTQAIVCNLAPILFIIFKENFDLTDEQLGRLIVFNFGTQIVADLLATKYCDRLGHRFCVMLAHILCAAGLVSISILPGILPAPYTGLAISAVIYAFGGGIIEVCVSPIVESLPGDEKARMMSLAHSFYCWGQMATVAITTIAIWLVGRSVWRIIPLAWAIIPLINVFLFAKVPMMPSIPEEQRTPIKELFKNRVFIIGMLMMIASGSSELSMSQWASLFVEESLGVSKVMGDLLGPCLFAFTMALTRVFFGIFGERISLEKALLLSSVLCVICYLLAVFFPPLTLVGCAMCGFTVAIMWPGTLSTGAKRFPLAGTALFGLYAICGDIGCSFGPWLAGMVSDLVNANENLVSLGVSLGWSEPSVGLRSGLMVTTVFPAILVICSVFLILRKTPSEPQVK